jgi:putative nucleotidyltransferase with HDIG domain
MSTETIALPVSRDDLEKAKGNLAVFPATAAELLMLLRTSNVSLSKICAIASCDPVLAANLVRFSNSALYSRGQEIRTLDRAVMQLGFVQTRFLILALCLKPMFRSANLKKIWNHSVKVAEIARHLAEQSPGAVPEEAMLIGLVHDIGRVVLLAPTLGYERAAADLRSGPFTNDIERGFCGATHAEVGADLLACWNFPADMVEAVRFHHNPMESQLKLGSLLYLAEELASARESPPSKEQRDYALNHCGIPSHAMHSLPMISGGVELLAYTAA